MSTQTVEAAREACRQAELACGANGTLEHAKALLFNCYSALFAAIDGCNEMIVELKATRQLALLDAKIIADARRRITELEKERDVMRKLATPAENTLAQNAHYRTRIAELEADNETLRDNLRKSFADVDRLRARERERPTSAEIIQDICELPDRTSPDDRTDMLLVSVSELEAILLNRGEK